MTFDSKEIRSWKKVYECDLDNIIIELKEAISEASVVILSGVVGASKTTFTKKFIGDTEQAMSPTYSIINDSGEVVHADFYRLESREEIIHLEIPLYLEDKKYFLVEWGKDYIYDISREVGDSYKYYELEITVNEKKEDHASQATRNFALNQIKF